MNTSRKQKSPRQKETTTLSEQPDIAMSIQAAVADEVFPPDLDILAPWDPTGANDTYDIPGTDGASGVGVVHAKVLAWQGAPGVVLGRVQWEIEGQPAVTDPIQRDIEKYEVNRDLNFPYDLSEPRRGVLISVWNRWDSGRKFRSRYVTYRDVMPPAFEIVAPQNNAQVPLGALTVNGWAEDRQSGVAAVEWSLDGGPFQAATFTPGNRVDWRFEIPNLAPGVHTIALRFRDQKGNQTTRDAASVITITATGAYKPKDDLASLRAYLEDLLDYAKNHLEIPNVAKEDLTKVLSNLFYQPFEQLIDMRSSSEIPAHSLPVNELRAAIEVLRKHLLAAFPLAHWKCDETNGTKLIDASAGNHHGTLFNGPTWITDGKLDGAVSFSGVSDYVQIDHAPDLEVGKNDADFSVTFWMNLRQGSTSEWRSIVHKGNTNEQRTFGIWMQPDNHIYYRISTTALNPDEGGSSVAEISPDTWTHIAYVKSGHRLQLYINGELDSEVSLTGASVSNDGPLYLGKDLWYPGINGSLDDIRIYGLALSEQAVQTVFTGQAEAAPAMDERPAFPLACWKCDDTSGTKLSDAAIGNHHGKLFSGPTWTAGKFDGAVSFSGVSDYAQIDHAPDLEVGKNDTDFSVTFWMNLREGPTTEWRSIVHKGNTNAQRTFAVWMQPHDNRIYYRISTALDHNEGGSSVAEIPLKTWTHIAYVKSGRSLKLYINGKPDSLVSLTGASVSNDGPLYLGKDPWYPGINGSLDDIRIYASALSAQMLQQVIAGEEPHFSAGPLARWKCDDASGTKLSDASTGNHHGKLFSGSTWIAGKLGGAVSFSGVSDYGQIDHTPALEVGKNDADFSVTFWMNLRQGFTGAWRSIVHKGNTDAQRTFAVWMHPQDNRIYYRISTDSDLNEGGSSVAEIPLNTWTHIAYVKSGRSLQLYINGKLNSEVTLTGASVSNDGPLYLGKDQWHPGINGSLDDIRIYGMALSKQSLQPVFAGQAEAAPAVTEADYRQAAYQALLTRIGTSYEEIRLIRGAKESNREALASRLGIALDRLEALLLPVAEITEAKLEELFGLADSTREPLGKLHDSPLLLRWRREYLEKLWRDQDAAEYAESKTPIIDPDQVVKDDLLKAEAGDRAFDLWQARSQWLAQTFDHLKQKREGQADALNRPTWTAGKFGGAVSFSGVSDYVKIDHAPDLEVGKNDADFSVTFWMNLREGPTTEWRSIVHKGNTNAQRTFAMWMHPNDNRIYYRISTTASDPNEGGSSVAEIPLNTWTHIAYVKSGRNLQLYINGKLDSEVTLTGASVSNIGPLYLGKDPWYPGINGSLDDIRIYDVALSEQRVKTVFAGEEPERLIDPLACWKCDDTSGTKLSDASAGNHHGTLFNGPTWIAGKFDGAVSFSGVSDYAQIDHAPDLEVGKNDGDFSVTFWMNLRESPAEWRSIMHKGNTNEQRTFGMWMDRDKKIYYRISTNALNPDEGGTSKVVISPDTWTHIAYVKSGHRLQLYINGELDSEVSLTGASVSNDGPLYLGKDPWYPGINGSLDDIRIYGSALSEQSVQAVFAGEVAKATIDSLARWNCDETSGTKLTDASTGNHHGTLFTGFDIFVAEILGKSLHELDQKQEAGTDIEPELKNLHLTRQAFTRLLRVRELVVQGTVRDTEWDDVYHILVQARKGQNYQAWTLEEREKEIALMPSLFQISETLPQLPRWRATWRARLNWQDTLQARIDQRQATEDALRAAVSAVEEQTLPLLRDALIADLAIRLQLSMSQAADWLVQRLMVDLKSNASQLTTRLIQAIETVQGVLFALRAGQLATSHPAAAWKLTVDEGHFDEEWQWLANYSTWRAAMFVFYFPEIVLLPSLREPYDANQPLHHLHRTKQFETLLKDMRKQPRLTPEQARMLAGNYLDTMLKEMGADFEPENLKAAIEATRPSTGEAPTFLTDQHTDETLSNLRSLCENVLAPKNNQPYPNYLQEIFYGVPMQLSWQLQKSGEYLAALDWLQTVYAYNLADKPDTPIDERKIYYGLERETNVAPILSRSDHWLTEGLNPHTIAFYRIGGNPHTRYTLISLARCMTEFADSEFTRDTAESLARARALYLTAERVLFSSDLDTPSDIPEDATVLPNPLLELLRLRVEIQLTKMRQGRNIAGMKRQVELPVSLPPGPNDLPMIGAGGQLVIPGARPARRPTPYYFRVLLERSKQLVNIAQQIEAAYLAALEKRDAENYNLLKANNDLQLAQMGEELQNRRVQEAQAGVGVARAQRQRAAVMSERYNMLSSMGLNTFEMQMISSFKEAISAIQQAGGASAEAARYGGQASSFSSMAAAQSSFMAVGAGMSLTYIPNIVAAGLHSQAAAAALSGASAQAAAAIYSANAQVAQTNASIAGVWASHESRRLDYETQAAIAEQEIAIGEAQIGAAQAHVGVSEQERKIAQTQISQAQAVADFLAKKFTNAELYEWMSGVLGEVYSYFLQQATALAQLAENQLAFERHDTPPKFIQADYWEVPSDTGLVTTTDQKAPDRKGLTGSARLLRDLYQLDQYAFETDKRKLNLSQTFSLSRMAPYDFELFRQTGVLTFATPMSLFDRDFPGHYLRLIKRVRASVIALIPPHHGIRATLTATGISRVVTGGDVFQQVVVRRDPELVALTSPISATGVFELDTQSEMLLPFESMGVDTMWEFQMPRAANPFDFRTIADVLVTIEYTALNSYEYRQQVLKTLDPKLSGERSYSFRNQFADAWYDLHNPDQSATPMTVKFKTWREDFPPNLDDLKIQHVLLFFSRVVDEFAEEEPLEVKSLRFTPKGKKDAVGGSATTIDGVISTRRGNGFGWNGMIGKTPAGEWELVLPNTDDMKNLFKDEKIDDILLVVTYGGRTPAWPA